MKPSDRPSNIPEKLWNAKMHLRGYWSEFRDSDTVGALELIIEYLIEQNQSLSQSTKDVKE